MASIGLLENGEEIRRQDACNEGDDRAVLSRLGVCCTELDG